MEIAAAQDSEQFDEILNKEGFFASLRMTKGTSFSSL
jgi:hypothetical protein